MNNIDLTARTAEWCLKSIKHIGSTTYVDICNNVEATVPWGASDWVLLIFGSILVLGVLVFLVSFAKAMFE